MEALIVIGLAAAIAGIAAVTVFRTQRRSEARQEQRPPAPWSRSEKLSLVSILVGAALGITGFVISGEGGEPPHGVDAVRRGGIRDVHVLQARGVQRARKLLGERALQLKARWPGDTLFSFFAHLEVYRSSNAAFDRAQARIREIKELRGPEVIRGSSESYCAYLDADGTWECGGSRGLV